MTSILVTGGAGYVGSVSVEAFLAAGHDVVVLDDLTTGHRAAVADGARLVVGSLRGPGRRDPAAARGLGSRRSSIARRGRWSASRSPSRRATTARTSRAASRSWRRRATPASGASCSRRPPRSTAIPDTHADPGGRAGSARSTRTARRSGPRGRARLVRPGVRPAQRVAALLQRRRCVRGIRRGPRPGDAPHPGRPRGCGADRPLTLFGDDYPTPDGTLHPRLHPRRGSRRGAPARDRGDGTRRPADGDGALVLNLGSGHGLQHRQVIARGRGRRSGARSRSSSARGALATRRSSSPHRIGRGEVLGWTAARPTLRGDGRLRLGVAPAPSGRLPRLSGTGAAWLADRQRSRGSDGALAGASRSGGARRPGPRHCPTSRRGPASSEPQADEHRHEQAQHRELVGAVARGRRAQEDDQRRRAAGR